MKSRLPIRRDIGFAYVSSLGICVGIAAASVAGFVQGRGGLYDASTSVLVSRGGDAANLLLVLPTLLFSLWLAKRGSLIGVLLWPGALFYGLYAYIPYLIGAPFTALFFVYVALVTLSAFTLIGLLASVDGGEVRQRLEAVPVRNFGGALVAIAVLAYLGLTVNEVNALANPVIEPAMRGHWVADWAVGTPALLLGGVLSWRRAPIGYVAAAGLLLVSAIGGVVFAFAAVVDNLLASPLTEPATIAVHLVIAAVSFALLGHFVRRASFGRARG
jgi:hypothetical protein